MKEEYNDEDETDIDNNVITIGSNGNLDAWMNMGHMLLYDGIMLQTVRWNLFELARYKGNCSIKFLSVKKNYNKEKN